MTWMTCPSPWKRVGVGLHDPVGAIHVARVHWPNLHVWLPALAPGVAGDMGTEATRSWPCEHHRWCNQPGVSPGASAACGQLAGLNYTLSQGLITPSRSLGHTLFCLKLSRCPQARHVAPGSVPTVSSCTTSRCRIRDAGCSPGAWEPNGCSDLLLLLVPKVICEGSAGSGGSRDAFEPRR